jgi:hypothetical protein
VLHIFDKNESWNKRNRKDKSAVRVEPGPTPAFIEREKPTGIR